MSPTKTKHAGVEGIDTAAVDGIPQHLTNVTSSQTLVLVESAKPIVPIYHFDWISLTNTLGTFLLALFTFFLYLVAKKTRNDTQEAAAAAKANAEAAKSNAEATRLNAEAMIRLELPLMVVDDVFIDNQRNRLIEGVEIKTTNGAPLKDLLQAKVVLGNVGRTPAYFYEHAVSWDVVPDLATANTRPFEEEMSIFSPKFERATQQQNQYEISTSIGAETFLQLPSAYGILRIRGYARYKDFMGASWQRDFCIGFEHEHSDPVDHLGSQTHVFTARMNIGGAAWNGTTRLSDP